MLNPRPAGSSGKTTPIRVNPDHLDLLRSAMLEKLGPRLKVVYDDDGDPMFADFNFVRSCGAGLDKVSDTTLIHLALFQMFEIVKSAPVGRCGIPLIDDITPGNYLADSESTGD